jgi:osmotically-inducible protein OsmY
MGTSLLRQTASQLHDAVQCQLDWKADINAKEVAICIRPVASPVQVKTLIADALQRNAEVDARRVHVDAHNGTATLTGTVSSWAEKNDAERAAWSADGVDHVENHLLVIHRDDAAVRDRQQW